MIESFEDLGLKPELVEALASEGIERPTELQEQAIPVLRRGHNLVARGGPGAGTLVAYGAPLLDRLEPGGATPKALVLVPSALAADALAESLARLATATGQTVAALGSPWAATANAGILFASPDAALDAVRSSRLKLDHVLALVIDGAAAIRDLGSWPAVETLASLVPHDAQRVLMSLPLDNAAEEFAERHVRRAARVPADAPPGAETAPPEHTIHYVVVEGSKAEAACAAVAHSLADGAAHVLLFCRSDDQAADAGDFLALHGFACSAPGDADAPVWLHSHAPPCQVGEASSAPEHVATLSYDVPPDPRTLLARHARGGPATTLVHPRELAHLRDIAARARFRALPAPPATAPAAHLAAQLENFRERLRRAAREEDLGPQLLLIEPLLREFAAAELAAAAVALLRKQPSATLQPEGEIPLRAPAPTTPIEPRRPHAWTRLFITIGQRDGIGPGDLLGAVTGETGIDGALVGKIEIRDTYSRVEIASDVAETVIRALNGTTIRGRSVRVDYDRAAPGRERGRRPPPRGHTPRRPND